VFDEQWRVIALHHGWTTGVPGPAGAEHGANEGIRLDRLLTAAKEINRHGAAG
jgi:hypothetical protein